MPLEPLCPQCFGNRPDCPTCNPNLFRDQILNWIAAVALIFVISQLAIYALIGIAR